MQDIYQPSKIRSWCFNIFLYLGTFILCILFLPTMFMTTKGSGCFPRIWSKIMRKALKIICNIEIEVKGLENLPKEAGYIVAAKHQSAMETVLFHGIIPNLFYVLKRELLFLPMAGFYFIKTGCVAIDRSGGTKTMRKMVAGVKKNLARGMNLTIFPEGTRKAPGSKEPYAPGVAFLYEQCGAPIVPVALNTGYCWGRNQKLKTPGIVTISFLPAIEPGLNKREFMKKLYDTIETEQDKLIHPTELLKQRTKND